MYLSLSGLWTYTTSWDTTKALLADLYAGSATYGDVAKARVKLEASYATKVQQKVDALIQQQAQNEQARQVAESQRQYAESQVRNAEAQRQQQLEAELQRQRVAQQQLEQQQAQLLLLQRQQRQAESAAAFNNGMLRILPDCRQEYGNQAMSFRHCIRFNASTRQL